MTDDVVVQARELRSRWVEAVSLDPRLSDAAARIGVVVAARFMHLQAGPKCGTVWPGAGTIAKETGKSLRTVKRAFGELREVGYLDPMKMGGGKQPSIYRLAIPVSGLAPVSILTPVPGMTLPGVKIGTAPVSGLAPNTVRKTPKDDTQGRRRARGAPADGYAFEGDIIRLTKRDLDNWRESFSAIEDLTAELRTIDAKLVDEGVDRKWFGKVAGWLRAKNEKIRCDRKSSSPLTKSGFVDSV
jgi:hypothetical protein